MSTTTVPSSSSVAESLASLNGTERDALLAELSDQDAAALLHDWRFWGRAKQLPPPGDWRTWILRAGRGFGKTRAGSGFVHLRAMAEARWIALVAKTPADARDYMIEGPGGFLGRPKLQDNFHPSERPIYEPSKRRLTWPTGSWATVYSSEEPDQLRGFSGDTAWLDEFAKWDNPRDCWDNLQFGMREASADRPRILITTTPRPINILREIESLPSSVTVVGDSYENRINLDESWFTDVIERYAQTSLGRQEVFADILDELPGALWTRENIEKKRIPRKPAELDRIVVAVDPAVTSKEGSDETGIVVVATAGDHGYVLEDLSGRKKPDKWARDAVEAYYRYSADRVVAEVNNGGDLVELTLRTVDKNVSYKAVHASRGKRVRAEPVAALYEQGRVHHVGLFSELEDQLCTHTPEEKDSPDRLDALVWGLTELMLPEGGFRVRSLTG